MRGAVRGLTENGRPENEGLEYAGPCTVEEDECL